MSATVAGRQTPLRSGARSCQSRETDAPASPPPHVGAPRRPPPAPCGVQPELRTRRPQRRAIRGQVIVLAVGALLPLRCSVFPDSAVVVPSAAGGTPVVEAMGGGWAGSHDRGGRFEAGLREGGALSAGGAGGSAGHGDSGAGQSSGSDGGSVGDASAAGGAVDGVGGGAVPSGGGGGGAGGAAAGDAEAGGIADSGAGGAAGGGAAGGGAVGGGAAGGGAAGGGAPGDGAVGGGSTGGSADAGMDAVAGQAGAPSDASPGGCQDRHFAASADAYIDEGAPQVNDGFGSALFVRGKNPSRRRTLIRFDLSPLAGRSIAGATLSLQLDAPTRALTLSVFPIAQNWSESEVSWSMSAANQPWSGGVTLPVCASTDLARNLQAGTIVPIDMTSAVQAVASGASANFGWLFDVDAPNGGASFRSKDPDAGSGPKLEVSVCP